MENLNVSKRPPPTMTMPTFLKYCGIIFGGLFLIAALVPNHPYQATEARQSIQNQAAHDQATLAKQPTHAAPVSDDDDDDIEGVIPNDSAINVARMVMYGRTCSKLPSRKAKSAEQWFVQYSQTETAKPERSNQPV